MAITTKINNAYINEKMLYSLKYNKHFDFNQVEDYKLTLLPINIYQMEIKTSEDVFIFKLSKNSYKILVSKIEESCHAI